MSLIPDEALDIARRAYEVGLMSQGQLERIAGATGPVSVLEVPTIYEIEHAERYRAQQRKKARRRWWRR